MLHAWRGVARRGESSLGMYPMLSELPACIEEGSMHSYYRFIGYQFVVTFVYQV